MITYLFMIRSLGVGLLKIVFAFSIVFPFSLNAFQYGAFSLKNNIGTFPNSSSKLHENEDRIFIHENLEGLKGYDLIAGVLDGHNGKEVVNFVSSSISRKFDEFFRSNDDFCEERFKELFQNLEQEIENQKLNSGSTAIMACIEHGNLWLINLGDSRAIYCKEVENNSENKNEIFSTKDHVPDFGTEDFKRIISKGGSIIIRYAITYGSPNKCFDLLREFTPLENNTFKEEFSNVCEFNGEPIFRKKSSPHNKIIKAIDNPRPMLSNFKVCSKDCRVLNVSEIRSLGMSRSFGDLKFKPLGVCAVPDVYSYVIQKNAKDFIVLASDGLWDVCDEKEVCNFVTSHRDLFNYNAQEICEALVKEAGSRYLQRKWEADDISVIVVFLD